MSETKNVVEYMYRYLEKYHGKYRVLSLYDISTCDWPRDKYGNIDESFDDLYIPCKKCVIKHCFDDFDKLALCFYDKQPSVAKKVFEEIKQKCPNANIKLEEFGKDSYIYFYDKDIDDIAKVVIPRTLGAKIKWHAKSNRKLMKRH